MCGRHLMFLCLGLAIAAARAADPAEQQKLDTAVDMLTRLENVNLEEKPAVKAAVTRALDKTRGTPNFVKLVRHFKLTNETAGLLEVAVRNSKEDAGVEAMRLLLEGGGSRTVQEALQSSNALPVIEALGNAKAKQSVPWLIPLVTDERRPLEVRRAAVRALPKTRDGAAALITLAREDKLPENLKFLSATELATVNWPEIKTEAAKVLPLPTGQNAQPLPPVSELAKRQGIAAKGAEIFRRPAIGCINCHQVRGEGRDVGPALSEIGTKLAKEALYEALLDPSAGISFGFESWQVQLKSGDEAYGLKVSETPAEIAIKDASGIVTRYKRPEVGSMQQLKTSIMPTGLQQALTADELVDLVEYLFSLKKQ